MLQNDYSAFNLKSKCQCNVIKQRKWENTYKLFLMGLRTMSGILGIYTPHGVHNTLFLFQQNSF